MKNIIMMTAALALLGIGTAPSFAANCGIVGAILGLSSCDGGSTRSSANNGVKGIDLNGDGIADVFIGKDKNRDGKLDANAMFKDANGDGKADPSFGGRDRPSGND